MSQRICEFWECVGTFPCVSTLSQKVQNFGVKKDLTHKLPL
jgi:hypothetical protein